MLYSVSSKLYAEVAARLTEAIAGSNYYSGTVEFGFGAIRCRFTASVIVYRRQVVYPEGVCFEISRLVPVWWEFHTTCASGERLNDFDFAELCARL